MTQVPTDHVGWSEALGTHAALPSNGSPGSETVIDASGKAWPMSPVNGAIRSQFEQKIRTEAILSISEIQAVVHPDEAKKWMSCYLEDRAAGTYSWGDKNLNETGRNGSAIRKALVDVPGMQYLFYLMLKFCTPEMTEAKAFQIFKESGVLGQDLGNAVSPPAGDKTTPENRMEKMSESPAASGQLPK